MARIVPSRFLGSIITLAAGVVLVGGGIAPAQTAPKPAVKTGELKKPMELSISPGAAPVPALKYRLLPSSADLNPGDAAPIYLRIRFQGNKQQEDAWSRTDQKALLAWLSLPLEKFPTGEVRSFIKLWASQLEQIEFGAHRRSCDWNYTLAEQRLELISVNLADAASMKEWGTLLALKARVEIAEGRLHDAVKTLESGISFARHVARGPAMINFLHGASIARLMLDRCEEFIAQQAAPNLYWALTALPRPLIGVREALEFDGRLCEFLIPELSEAELARPRSAPEWATLLARMHERIVNWSRRLWSADSAGDANHPLKIMGGSDLTEFKAKVLPLGRDALKKSRKLTDAQLSAMSDDQIVALYLADGYRTIWDDLFKGSYLPACDALREISAAQERVHASKYTPLTFFVGLVPAVWGVVVAELQLDRRVAILRVIEALRMDAAHESALPESLTQITEVPVSDDPVTGKPFLYRRDGSAVLLSTGPSSLPSNWDLSYRIMLRRSP
jgi:hypothetical protein